MGLNVNVLEVQHDIDSIFDDTRNRGILMVGAFNAESSDGSALNAREKYTTE